ncbi:MAG: leucine-rich repeat domain-containing protein [Lachnospiraceae bacterium]|jgi:hypothetical protein|nr:leucine-rich repeat domain-containing protein [Lachnospiraceae bacterium]
MKKLATLILVLAVALNLAACGGSGHAANPESDFEYRYSEANKGAMITKYVGTAADVYIPSELGGQPVVAIDKGAFFESGIEYVYIPEGVKAMWNSAFAKSKKLRKVELPESLMVIGANAFRECSGLAEVKIPKKSFLEIQSCAFMDCKALSTLTFSQSYGVSMQAWAFRGCTSLREVTLDGNKMDGYIGMQAFRGCTSLASFKVTGKVTYYNLAAQAFSGCSNLKNISLANEVNVLTGAFDGLNAASVTYAGETCNAGDFKRYDEIPDVAQAALLINVIPELEKITSDGLWPLDSD